MNSMPVDFFFDAVSPYSWLASQQLDAIEDVGGCVICRPVLLAVLLNAHGTLGPAEVPAKRAYTFRDVMREADRLGLEFRGPPAHPFNPLHSLRIAVAIEDDRSRLAYARALLSAVWSDGNDPAENSTLRTVLEECGIQPDPILDACGTQTVKSALKTSTQTAVDAGVFGVPTLRIGSELFWGADRIDAAVWALKGGRIDEATYAEVIARPSQVQRRR